MIQIFLDTPHLQFGHLERRLIHSYEPEEIKNLIIQMGHLKIRNAIWKINNKVFISFIKILKIIYLL